MSHKYYGFQKEKEDNLYTIPFLSTKTKRLRFLNNEFVGYGERNEFIVHKNPGLTILRLGDNQINRGVHNLSNTSKLMNEFLSELLQSSNYLQTQKVKNFNQVKIKEIKVNSKSSIQIKLNAY
uniref:Uncharacterized protein n=1 Tax=Eustigmatophyceae sp. Ndem 8/9T-3m6.8 TaxID=2506146 RepID=A0A3R5QSI5_9STRA|nr:hypothetical protein Ycf95 [Eustigmatophyceae sp. Ndem 8/9T-3m6.8]QAA11914.1 hypothetical protein Ycf95 [Eustigmatophyceae sp. Ndem 8/9T-3m6.8]